MVHRYIAMSDVQYNIPLQGDFSTHTWSIVALLCQMYSTIHHCKETFSTHTWSIVALLCQMYSTIHHCWRSSTIPLCSRSTRILFTARLEVYSNISSVLSSASMQNKVSRVDNGNESVRISRQWIYGTCCYYS